MKDTIRGVSAHYCSSGLLYYVHYDKQGTKQVDHELFHQSLQILDEWRKKAESEHHTT